VIAIERSTFQSAEKKQKLANLLGILLIASRADPSALIFKTPCVDPMELRNFTHFAGLTGCNEALNRREGLFYIICARFFFLDPCNEHRNLLFHAHSKRAFPDIAFPFCFTIALAGIKSDCYFTKRRTHMHRHTHSACERHYTRATDTCILARPQQECMDGSSLVLLPLAANIVI
jgi:hypothetical protein